MSSSNPTKLVAQRDRHYADNPDAMRYKVQHMGARAMHEGTWKYRDIVCGEHFNEDECYHIRGLSAGETYTNPSVTLTVKRIK